MSSSQAIDGTPFAAANASASWRLEAWVDAARPTAPQLPPPEVLSLYGRDSPLWQPYLSALQPMPAVQFAFELEQAADRTVGGYATAGGRANGSAGSKGASGNSTRGEWGFLNDSHLSIEDKLFQFIKLAQKKSDDELEKKMREYRDKYCASGASKSDDGGGTLGFLESVFSGGWLVDALKDVGGLLGRASAVALGLAPFEGALALAGKELGGVVSKALGLKKSSSSGSSEKGEAGSPDERLDMLEIQRLADKQKQMFECVSNVLRVIHETAMTAVGNIR